MVAPLAATATMFDEIEYTALAAQAERLGDEAPDRQIASGWRRIASGFRQLARLRAGAAQHWKSREAARQERPAVRP